MSQRYTREVGAFVSEIYERGRAICLGEIRERVGHLSQRNTRGRGICLREIRERSGHEKNMRNLEVQYL